MKHTLITQLVQALSQGEPVEADTPSSMWLDMAISCGADPIMEPLDASETMAVILGETVDTCEGWRTGGEHRLEALHSYVRTLRLPIDARDDDAIAIRAEDHHGMDGTQRAGNLALHDGTMTRVVDAYVAGDYDAAAQALVDGIRDGWYHRQYSGTLAAERAAAAEEAQ